MQSELVLSNKNLNSLLIAQYNVDEMYLSHMGASKQGRTLQNKTLIIGIYEKITNNLVMKVLKKRKQQKSLEVCEKTRFICMLCPYWLMKRISWF